MANPSEIFAEIARVEAEIESDAGKGRRTVLKAYHAKLCRQYMKALAGQRVAA